jgi:hypothetical protein
VGPIYPFPAGLGWPGRSAAGPQLGPPVKVARCAVEAALACDRPPEDRWARIPGRSLRRNGKCGPPAYSALCPARGCSPDVRRAGYNGPFPGKPSCLRRADQDGIVSFHGVRCCTAPASRVVRPYGRPHGRARPGQGRFLNLFDPSDCRLIRHTIRPKGPPVLLPDCYP